MAEIQKIKNQHYIPQGHLRKFTYDGEQLFVFDKMKGSSRQTRTTAVGSENYFNDLQPDIQMHFKDPQLVEHIFSDLEAIFYKLRDELLTTADSQGSITQDQKMGMAYFLMLQLLRTAEYRRELIDMINGFKKERITWDDRNVSFLQASIFLHSNMLFPYVEVLNKHIWIVGVNTEGPHSFYTSDAPIVMKAHSARHVGMGIGSPGIEIAFPLTSHHILILKERTFFQEFAHLDMTVQKVSNDEVLYYNRLQVLRSYRQVYCSSDDFSVGKQICERFLTADRTRVDVHSFHPSPERKVLHFVSPDPDRAQYEIH